jgi:hypothetical protein
MSVNTSFPLAGASALFIRWAKIKFNVLHTLETDFSGNVYFSFRRSNRTVKQLLVTNNATKSSAKM